MTEKELLRVANVLKDLFAGKIKPKQT